MMSEKDLLIQQICDVDKTADPRFLDVRTEDELDEYFRFLANLERTKSTTGTN